MSCMHDCESREMRTLGELNGVTGYHVSNLYTCGFEEVVGFEKLPISVTLDKHGTPLGKLPDCPRCGEDELGVINQLRMICYSCGFEQNL